MGEDRKDLTPTQQSILYKKRDNPEWSNAEIADAVGCSDSHVSETLNRWDPEDMREDGTVVEKKPISITSVIWILIKLSVYLLLWPISIPYFTWKFYKKAKQGE